MCTTCPVSRVLSVTCGQRPGIIHLPLLTARPSSPSRAGRRIWHHCLPVTDGPFVLRHSERCVRQLVCHSPGNSRALVSPRVRCSWYLCGSSLKIPIRKLSRRKNKVRKQATTGMNSVAKRSQTLQTTYFMIPFTINMWSVHKRHIYCEKEDICSFPSLRVGTVTSTGHEAWFWNDEKVLDCINNDSTLYIC